MRVAIPFLTHIKKVRVGFEVRERFSAGSSEGLIALFDLEKFSGRGLSDPAFRKVHTS